MQPRRPRILVTESAGFPPTASELLTPIADLTLRDCDRTSLVASVREADILWVRLRHCVDAEVMNAGESLRAIVTPTTGLNHIDVQEAARRGIQILSLRGHTDFLKDVRATAEHTIGLMLSLLRKVPTAVAHTKNGGWSRDPFKGHELYGKTVGVVGYGRLGRIVARYLRAFETRVLASDKNAQKMDVEPDITPVSLGHLLCESDLVTLHVSLSEETYGFFGKREFDAMKQGAWFINTSRGELVDEEALLQALQSGLLAGAALDVLCGEHSQIMAQHPLIAYAKQHENLIVTPHIGGCTEESMTKAETFLAEQLCALLRVGDLIYAKR
jgi:D-3-phosphoglycerate dehydrogenase / 2-oxoglutarate reductase